MGAAQALPLGPMPPSKIASPPQKPYAQCSAKIAALHVEIEVLCKKLFKALDHPALPSSHTILTTVPNPTHPPPPPSSVSSVKSYIAHPDHKWLQPVLDHKHCPPFLVSTDSSITPFLVYAIPDDVQQVLQVQHKHHPPVYIEIDSNGDLQMAIKAPGELITMSVIMPLD